MVVNYRKTHVIVPNKVALSVIKSGGNHAKKHTSEINELSSKDYFELLNRYDIYKLSTIVERYISNNNHLDKTKQ